VFSTEEGSCTWLLRFCCRFAPGRYKELEKYILERRDALGGGAADSSSKGDSGADGTAGREVTAAELMGEGGSKPRGFA
jgi:hypothetical protein